MGWVAHVKCWARRKRSIRARCQAVHGNTSVIGTHVVIKRANNGNSLTLEKSSVANHREARICGVASNSSAILTISYVSVLATSLGITRRKCARESIIASIQDI
jgi:hypothetical protein